MTMTNTAPNSIEQAKREALAELHGYRERLRIEREAKARADQTAEDEIAVAITRRREEAAKEEALRLAMKDFWAKREADLKAQAAAEREAPRRIMGVGSAPPPARRVVRLLRDRLGDDFPALVADIKACDFRQFQIEVARLPHDEQAERLNREREAQAAAMAAAAKTLPEPEDATEVAILAKHGFVPESPAPEAARTAA